MSRRRHVHHFTASEQLAIQFVLRHLVQPMSAHTSSWQRPVWCNFVWFTEIVPAAMRTIEVNRDGDTQIETVERDVIFRLGKDDVVIVTMHGERTVTDGQPNAFISWAIRRVRYRLRWNTGHDNQGWVDRELTVRSLTGLPSVAAPIG